MSLIGNYPTVYKNSKKTVNSRRINREWMRSKLSVASFVNRPRLVKARVTK